jgi:ribulose kinase
VAYLDVGAAIMAAVGVGAHPSLADAVRAMTRIERTFEPDVSMKPRYDALYDTYVRSTQLLKPVGLIGR